MSSFARSAGYDEKRSGDAQPFQLGSHDRGIAAFPVVEGQQAEWPFASRVDAVLEVAEVNEIKPTAEHVDVTARLLKTENVLVNDDTTCLGQTDKSKRQTPDRVQRVLEAHVI